MHSSSEDVLIDSSTLLPLSYASSVGSSVSSFLFNILGWILVFMGPVTMTPLMQRIAKKPFSQGAAANAAIFTRGRMLNSRPLPVELVPHDGQPSIYDVLYKNPMAVKNRLYLFHLLQMSLKFQYDLPAFKGTAFPLYADMRLQNTRSTQATPDIRYTFTVPSFCPRTFANAAVSVCIYKASSESRSALLKSGLKASYNKKSACLFFKVSKFPFRELNMSFARQRIRQLFESSNAAKG